jgi:hypothetical protein
LGYVAYGINSFLPIAEIICGCPVIVDLSAMQANKRGLDTAVYKERLAGFVSNSSLFT